MPRQPRRTSNRSATLGRSLRVLYAISGAELGGAQNHLLALIDGMPQNKVLVLVGTQGYLTEELDRRGVEHEVLPGLSNGPSPGAKIAAVRRLRQRSAEWRPDLIHLHSTMAGLLGRYAVGQAGPAVLFTAHGWSCGEGTPFLRRLVFTRLERWAARRTDLLLCVSAADAAFGARLGVRPRLGIVTVPNGVPDPGVGPPDPQGGTVALMVGRFGRQKDHATLLRAWREAGSGHRLLLLGSGDASREVRRARRLGVAEQVEFLPSSTSTADALRRSGLVVLASRWEGLPLALLEAMGAGRPVVATDVGGVRDAVLPGTTGWLVPQGDPVAFAAALRDALSDPARLVRMGAAARKAFERSFTLERMVEGTRSAYAAAVTRSPGAPPSARRRRPGPAPTP